MRAAGVIPQAAAGTRSRLARAWFALLLGTICFEGLGRKLLPEVPSAVFYFLKDAVLLSGLVAFGIRSNVARLAGRYFGAFVLVLFAAFAWTVAQIFNPSQEHFLLAILGLRAYWLWWLAPVVVASAVVDTEDRRAALRILTAIALVVVAYAAYQFAAPADSPLNTYALFEGEVVTATAIVGTTGRARVSSTFSYLTGFTDFLVVVPVLLFALGLSGPGRRTRAFALTVASVAAAAIPMSASRAPLVLAAAGFGLVVWRTGLVQTRVGRRAFLGATAAALIAFVALPTAVEGVRDRFRGEDTSERIAEALQLLPPVALSVHEYPLFGDGTGMQQNARLAFGIASRWDTESESSRLLAELGPLGYLLVWGTKLGLAIALLRAARTLKRTGNGPLAGGATALALFAFMGNLVFDHIWQSLLFVGVGLVLREAVAAHGAEA